MLDVLFFLWTKIERGLFRSLNIGLAQEKVFADCWIIFPKITDFGVLLERRSRAARVVPS